MAKRVQRTASPPAQSKNPLFQTEHTFEWEGVTYTKGDPIRIDGERGPFTFHYAARDADGTPTVTVWWDGHHFRAFRADRIAGEGVARPGLCPVHPMYTAQRRPRSGCGACYAAWETAHPERAGSSQT